MRNWLKENWFKLCVLAILLYVAYIFKDISYHLNYYFDRIGEYYFNKPLN